MGESENPVIRVDLGKYGQKSFSSFQEVASWIQGEREFWKWLPQILDTDRHIALQVQQKVQELFGQVENFVSAARQEPFSQRENRAQQIASVIAAKVKRENFILSEFPEGKFINDLQQENPRISAYVAGYFFGIPINWSDKLSAEGAFLAMAYKYGYRDKTKSERNSLEALRAEWSILLSEAKGTLEIAERERTVLGEQHIRQIGEHKKKFEEWQASSQAMFVDLMDRSGKALENISKTYDEKLAVQASVVYWKNKAEKHARLATKLAWAASLVGISVAILLGFETFLAIGPLEKLGDLPVWKGSMLILTAVIGVWAIRILVRLLLSNLHLESDAVERRTMLMTYLALLRRGQGPDENQRELILQVLFRPSITGIVKDDGMPPILAKWMNSVTAN